MILQDPIIESYDILHRGIPTFYEIVGLKEFALCQKTFLIDWLSIYTQVRDTFSKDEILSFLSIAFGGPNPHFEIGQQKMISLTSLEQSFVCILFLCKRINLNNNKNNNKTYIHAKNYCH
jgi:hypothetical protein